MADETSLRASPAACPRALLISYLTSLSQTLRLLREVIADCSDDDGWAELSEVGAMLSQRKADFDTRSFGFKKLSKLLISGKQKELFVVQAIRDSKKVRHKGGVE